MRKLSRKLRGLFWRTLCLVANGRGIAARKIVFNQTDGCGFGCNQKAIAAELLRRRKNLDLVWLVRGEVEAKTLPEGIRAVPFFSFAALAELTKARVWCSNQYFRHHVQRMGLRKRPGQFYVQTWHGSLGIKNVHSGASWEKVAPDSAGNEFKRLEGGMVDAIIANSAWDAERQLDHFYGHGEVKLFGHPRNDLFFHEKTRDEVRRKVFSSLGIPAEGKLALYAPTLRLDKKWDGYWRDWHGLSQVLAQRFGGTWHIAAKMHPVLLHKGRTLGETGEAINASNWPDIQELLAAADVLISDYSSCMFDFMLLRRPVFVYAPDLDAYEKEQGLLYPLSDTPFPFATTRDGFLSNIQAFDENEYKSRCETFLQGKGCVEDGHAAERTADLILSIVEEA